MLWGESFANIRGDEPVFVNVMTSLNAWFSSVSALTTLSSPGSSPIYELMPRHAPLE